MKISHEGLIQNMKLYRVKRYYKLKRVIFSLFLILFYRSNRVLSSVFELQSINI